MKIDLENIELNEEVLEAFCKIARFLDNEKIGMKLGICAIGYLFSSILADKFIDEEDLRDFHRYIINLSKAFNDG